jgi:hydroxysqualene synthase
MSSLHPGRADKPLPGHSAIRPVQHYENFPVASWLCPPRLRPPIAAIYAFARTADDLADEGDAPAAHRLSDLADYRQDLQAACESRTGSGRWADVFEPLAPLLRRFHLPTEPLHALLDAFQQDVHMTRDGAIPTDLPELLRYCERSANPIGRLLLHLYGIEDAPSLTQSDAICSALQLINFWQDLSVDLPRGRYYLPQDRCLAHGVDPRAPAPGPGSRALVSELVAHAQTLMLSGAPLVHRLPGRMGWELRLVVQGGLRIAERLAAQPEAAIHHRPVIRVSDSPHLLWRSLWM